MEGTSADAAVTEKPPKSPPLAFQMSSNDALWAPVNPMTAPVLSFASSPHFLGSPSENEMQAQVDKLNEALRLQYQASVAERESWQLEKDRLYRRIASLESLLKLPNGQSPARSPAMSPQDGPKTTLGAPRLASIAEVDTSPKQPVVPRIKRESAPARIDLSTIAKDVPLDGAAVTEPIDSELPVSPPVTRATLSPPPLANRHLAGHTPLRAPRPGDFSPAMSSFSERLTDTPTRSNTALNETLTQDDIDEDRPLKGPLHMPALPGSPGEGNFTMEMLDAKLKDVMEHPDENRPLVLQISSPVIDGASEATSVANDDPAPKVDSAGDAEEDNKGNDLDNGGIRLRKQMSCNFGAPLGQLGHWKH